MINNNYYCNMLASKITVKQVLYAVLALILTYLGFLRPILLKADFAATIEDMQCQDIWDYMADFSNYGVLNPEVIDFEILDESHGPHGEWKYSVLYREYFEHLPNFMENSAIGHYRVFKDNGIPTIDSDHITCMIPSLNWYCLKTTAQDKFVQVGPNSCHITESIYYECPLLLIPLCKAEVSSQRSKVMHNLKELRIHEIY